MRIRPILKSFCFIIFFSGLLFVGYTFLAKLQEKKIQYDLDLYSLIPDDCYAIFHLHNLSHCLNDSLLSNIFPVLWDRSLNSLLVDEAMLSLHDEGAILYKKVSSEITDFFPSNFKSDFDPYVIKGDRINIHVITTTDNRFFCYFYYQGVWVGSYRKRLLDRVVQYWNGYPLKKEKDFLEVLNGLGKSADANIIMRSDSIPFIGSSAFNDVFLKRCWVGCDLVKNDRDLWFTGLLHDVTNFQSIDSMGVYMDLFSSNCHTIYIPPGAPFYDVCFSSDSCLNSQKVSIMFIRNGDLFNRYINEFFASKAVVIHRDFAIFADSSEVINSFISVLDQDSCIYNPFVRDLISTSDDEQKGCVLVSDLSFLLSDSTNFNLKLPAWIGDYRYLFHPYQIYYYTYKDSLTNNCFFNLILSPQV